MRGHEQILAARRARQRPAVVFFDLRPAPTPRVPIDSCRAMKPLRRALYDPECALESGQFPTVYVDETDLRGHLDLRFLVGCNAVVTAARWSQDLIAFGERVAAASAGGSVAVSAPSECDDLMLFSKGEWTTNAV